jgi:hypothetical protein
MFDGIAREEVQNARQMTEKPTPPPAIAPDLEIDLAQSFLPAWAREPAGPAQISRMAERYGGEEREERPGKRRDHGPRQDRQRAAGGKRAERRNDARSERRPEREHRPVPALAGWDVRFLPEPRGVEGLARQIKAAAKAYPLFDLALLVLEKPERYLVELRRTSESGPVLFQLSEDGSAWLSEREAVAHAITHRLEKFYRRERVTTEPPKGAYPFVAVCGMSGVLLGPPNYHDYQMTIRRLHAERFASVPFEVYKSRIRMARDEESIQKWKEEQSVKDEFHPVEASEGAEPVKLGSLEEMERHFREHHAASCITSIPDRVIASGPAVQNGSSTAVQLLVRRALEELRRFPLPLAHTLSQELASRGLQIFKAHENITYVSVARPRHLDREATPVADGPRGILDYLESNPSTVRNEQWKALVAMRPGSPGSEEAESAVARDLLWLLREGYAVDYARRGLEASPRSKPRPARAGHS